ncbi:uncharacterized protein A4U43_C01F17970 [Asparagus officinalis]|uniref:Uncharacterized protein n=1 Tax=Asparagus officinalis TaxID=4686 RepID=A0A5P1FS01_ASPOF|nr:uncharacterized protein A4U43_C01F17970 [Asparagus officinalis]
MNSLSCYPAYVGLATIVGFIWWFVYSDAGPRLPYKELVNFDTFSTGDTTYPCSIFDDRHPSTMSMTVLVVVEMFNALNNLSENQSLLDALFDLDEAACESLKRNHPEQKTIP